MVDAAGLCQTPSIRSDATKLKANVLSSLFRIATNNENPWLFPFISISNGILWQIEFRIIFRCSQGRKFFQMNLFAFRDECMCSDLKSN